ncbi:chloride channel protein [Deminuibacter soli]|uniref:Chloride channel protein n=1 Tax=Deminuibacter soli TaxID=2291815 RepID=A0A3E1NES0_9BACT|nr:chloride channel protein [Deminuibacter soli]RFM26479.1 chloride channel protein [Deminuibacter soli]
MLSFIHLPVRRSVLYLKKKLTEKQFLLFACIVVGATASLAAVLLKLFVFRLEELFFKHMRFGNTVWLQSLLPMAGIGLTALMIYRLFRNNFQKGNDKIVYAIAKKGANLPFSQVYSHLLTSGVTVGLGGSAGLESPMVATGAAIGSNFGRVYYLPYKERTVLLACGIASGISSAFSAPIAGVLFALEVLMIDITITTFIPLIISAATGALIAKIILGDEILLNFRNMQPFNYSNTFFYIGLGLLCGLLALYYARVFTWLEHRFEHITSRTNKWLIGGSLLAVLIFLFPPLFGEGYATIKSLAENNTLDKTGLLFFNTNNSWLLIAMLSAVILLKVFATSFTLQGGGNGGSFAPALLIGGLLGYVAAQLCHHMGYQVPTANFIVVGMAGLLSGLFFAPLTAIFLSAEITGGYSLIIPLMLVSAISFFVVKSFEPLSMEMKKLSLSSKLNPSDKDKFLLSRLELLQLVEKDHLAFPATMPWRSMLKLIAGNNKDVYAVLDENKKLIGSIYLNDIKSILLDDQRISAPNTAADVMLKQTAVIDTDDVESVLYKFEQQHATTLAVTGADGRFIGFITKSAILDRYRKEIIHYSYN